MNDDFESRVRDLKARAHGHWTPLLGALGVDERILNGKNQPCPLCGGTHACAALAEGNLLAAWQAAPALMPVLALALVHTVQLAYEALYARRVAPAWRIGARAWGAAGAAMLVLWGMRLAGLV